MSPLVREEDATALRKAWDELRLGLATLCEQLLGPLTKLRQTTTVEPRFMHYRRSARSTILHDRETDRLLPLPASDVLDVAQLLTLYPSAFWSTETARREVDRAISRGEGEPVLPEVTLSASS